MSGRYAIVSIGTNSTRVLLADVLAPVPRVELARSTGTRIGEGLDARGSLGEEPMRRTLEAVRSHVRAVHGRYVKLFAIATSAVRRAENGEAFTRRVTEAIGVPVDVLTGEQEAAAAYRGAITAVRARAGQMTGVVDCGGGSTEYATGTGVHPERTASCEIGAVRLTEAVPQLAGHDGAVAAAEIERARAAARYAVAACAAFPPVAHLVLVGGSATSAAAVVLGGSPRAAAYRVTRDDLGRALMRLCALGYKERTVLPGVKPQRADILPGGILVLDAVLETLGHDAAMITSADLLLGYLLAQSDSVPKDRKDRGRSSRSRPY